MIKMNEAIKGVVYSGILSALLSVYFIRILKASKIHVLGISVVAFAVFLALWLARKKSNERTRRALVLVGLIAILSLIIAPLSVPLAVNTFVTFTVGALALIYREELLPSMSAFMYAWLGAIVGFVIAVIVFPHTHMGDVARALGLIGLILVFATLFLMIGRKVHYRPFNRYPV
ncbi:hypothetical protein [Thermococcus sp.]|uniref:hypothetical protein n=1 Tax=Thermococcus sp. TaxID=35749 RepID=UPI002628016E|nr:hypothetical protein [Thermococcus sp.]